LNWILYLIIFWIILIGINIVNDFFKSEKELLESINDKILGYYKSGVQYYGLLIITMITISLGSSTGFFDQFGQSDIGDEYISELESLYQDIEYDNVNFQTFQSRYEKIQILKKEMYIEDDKLSKKQRIKEVEITDKIKLLSEEKFKELIDYILED